MIMGVTRSAYIARCKFHTDRPRGLIRFYFVPETHERFLEPTVFYPWKEYQQYKGNLAYGEDVNHARPWDPGTDRYGLPGTSYCGPLSHFLGRSPFDPSLPCCGTACFLNEIGTGFALETVDVDASLEELVSWFAWSPILEDESVSPEKRLGLGPRVDEDVTGPPLDVAFALAVDQDITGPEFGPAFEVTAGQDVTGAPLIPAFHFSPAPARSGGRPLHVPGLLGGAIPLWDLPNPIPAEDVPFLGAMAPSIEPLTLAFAMYLEYTDVAVIELDLAFALYIDSTVIDCTFFTHAFGMYLETRETEATPTTLGMGMFVHGQEGEAGTLGPWKIGMYVSVIDAPPPMLGPGGIGMAVDYSESCALIAATMPANLIIRCTQFVRALDPACDNGLFNGNQWTFNYGTYANGDGWQTPDISDPACDVPTCGTACDPFVLWVGCQGDVLSMTHNFQPWGSYGLPEFKIRSYFPVWWTIEFGPNLRFDITEV